MTRVIGGRGALWGVVTSGSFLCASFGLVPVRSEPLLWGGGEENIHGFHIVLLVEVEDLGRGWTRLSPGVRGYWEDVGARLDLPVSPYKGGILVLKSRDRACDGVSVLFPSNTWDVDTQS